MATVQAGRNAVKRAAANSLVAWPNTRPCQGRERRFESGRDRHKNPKRRRLAGEVAESG